MKELIRSNDPVLLSFTSALLKEHDIETVLFDTHMSVLEGSIGAIPRRLMVLDEDFDEAVNIMREAGHGDALAESVPQTKHCTGDEKHESGADQSGKGLSPDDSFAKA